MKTFHVSLVLLFPVLTVAQNLVPNPSFEEYFNCPGTYNTHTADFQIHGWYSATKGTPDHFHSCSRGEANVPYNWAGVSEAYDGKGYTGIYMWMDRDFDYREYLQCRLLEPLLKDSLYNIEFYFRLSSYSKYAIDRIGILLTDTMIRASHDRVLRNKSVIDIVRDSALTQSTGIWERAHLTYKATGGEQFLTLGNFSDNHNTRNYKIQFRPVQQDMLAGSAYYYIDNVEVLPSFSPKLPEILPEFNAERVEFDKTYVLRNIQFEFNSYKLVPPSFDQLDQVAEYLHENFGVNVQVSGHTDDVGSDRYNFELSRQRAQSAANYLIRQGISSQRIEIFGYGKSRPLLEGTSEEVRRQNRRVEVRFAE